MIHKIVPLNSYVIEKLKGNIVPSLVELAILPSLSQPIAQIFVFTAGLKKDLSKEGKSLSLRVCQSFGFRL